MKNRVPVAIFVVLLLIGLVAVFLAEPKPDPKDLSYWVAISTNQDWSAEATQGKSEAQFYLGLTLIRTNLMKMVDRVPRLSAIPVIGKRLFQKTSYGIDNRIAPEHLIEAYRWIKKSADQNFAPANEAEKLFAGRIPVLVPPADPAQSSTTPRPRK